ncbi:apolipoprotein N-acyltransferase [Sphingomonas lenta]|uniref:Apolipoprotein N-acyltransferase n=1 Tax=Sphingomonas lenta TaxID=1141887 RepID=A0A2A2SEU7_9SPHN|nr:apolipoprotein N-acyltransferase [Sphingomonas lenta]PAX07776.1 apolipoprotein N-acyltransferase [Sphingomonas lenta]
MLRYPALLSLALGAIAATGFAPLQLWPLTLLCLAAWAWIVHHAPSLKSALWRGYAFGVGHFTVNNNWFQHAFDFQDAMPPVLGYFAAVALAVYLAVYPAMAAGIAWRFRGKKADTPYVLAFGAAWIATEYLRGVLFTGYAWDPVSVVWLPVIGVARLSAWVGTYALSGLTVALAVSLLLLLRRRWTMPAIGLGVTALAALSAPLTRAPDAVPGGPLVRVVQPNIGQHERGPDDGERVLRALLERSGEPGPRQRLVVWPEGVVRDLLEDGYPGWVYAGRPAPWTRRRIASVLGPRDLVVTGGTALEFTPDERIASATNSVFAIDARGRLIGRYDKAHLVPYGEYLPMPWLLEPLGLRRLVPGDFDFSPGPGPHNLALPGLGPVGMQLCYEIIFSGEVVDDRQRPSFIFNPSNDAWFGKWGPPQHLAQARMRAIEEGLPIIRATPTGISAIIAADGRLLATIPHETAGAIELPVPPPLPPTLFARLGNLLALIVELALLLGAVAFRARRR